MSIQIVAQNIYKKYDEGKVTVINNLSVTIQKGEFFTLLGPSGCGKTTFLRMIAGFNTLEGGKIYFDDQVINDIPVSDRNIGMVFQNYAIFPHLSVFENVAFGLKQRKIPKDKIKKLVDEVLKAVRMDEYADRSPEKLSGGQQQRIALARAIVIKPSVLLMDEPLSNLDTKLRIEMRSTIRELQKDVGITTVYVTHDQEEALAISDRIAVMNKGEIQQIDNPTKVYSRPANTFVATFIGFSNLFEAVVVIKNNQKMIKITDECIIEVPNLVDDVFENQKVIVSIRPDEFIIADQGIHVRVLSKAFLGQTTSYKVDFYNAHTLDVGDQNEITDGMKYVATTHNPNDEFRVLPMAEKINVFNTDGSKSLIKDVLVYGKD